MLISSLVSTCADIDAEESMRRMTFAGWFVLMPRVGLASAVRKRSRMSSCRRRSQDGRSLWKGVFAWRSRTDFSQNMVVGMSLVCLRSLRK